MPLHQPGLPAYRHPVGWAGEFDVRIAALDGWDDLNHVETYTKSAQRQKLAENVVDQHKKSAEEEELISPSETKWKKWQTLPIMK